MLSGRFENCFGLRVFDLKAINFTGSNKAIIYAPNGAMKTSFTKSIDLIQAGNAPIDRIFGNATSFTLTYKNVGVSHLDNNDELKSLKAYVIHSFDEEYQSDSISTLLVDKSLREEYDEIYISLSKAIDSFEKQLNMKSKVVKKGIRSVLAADFGLDEASEWGVILPTIKSALEGYNYKSNFKDVSYQTLFNSKTTPILSDVEFKSNIEKYIDIYDGLLSRSLVLAKGFDDHNVIELGKSFKKNDLFRASHEVRMKDGTNVKSVKDWEDKLAAELSTLESSAELNSVFNKIGKLLNANIEGQSLKHLLDANRFVVKYLNDPKTLKRLLWLNYIAELESEFLNIHQVFIDANINIQNIYDEANREKDAWERVVSDFNNRFMVPFQIRIKNQANILLKGEAPNIVFVYRQGCDEVEKTQKDLMEVLSMGEKRALYLLHVLFDIQKIKLIANSTNINYLVVADDIADSFDYKNKYAIVEYLKEISDVQNIDLLVLTHNFDFYRTLAGRLDIKRENSFIVQRDTDENLIMSRIGYRSDVFKHEVVKGISNGQINNDKKKKWLIASIPFIRNLSEYKGDDEVYIFLTELLHLKEKTESITIETLWAVISNIITTGPLVIDNKDAKVIDWIFQLADDICANLTEEVHLENKIVMSIAIRLRAEQYMSCLYLKLGKEPPICTSNQTRQWLAGLQGNIDEDKRKILEQVNIMTPENIHINAFMYEPIIDLSDWHLKRLYESIKGLAV